ncbi:MAG: hypothetical protein JSR86_01700 [Proteobacteria bacterium]|nr:hypothetical protein [Pseudomonadota bacterium]
MVLGSGAPQSNSDPSKRWILRWNLAAVVLAVWAGLWPHPFALVAGLCGAAPIAALFIARRAGGLLGTTVWVGRGRPTIGPLAIFPPIALVLHIAGTTKFMALDGFILPGAAGAGAAVIATVMLLPQSGRRSLDWLAVAALGAAVGVGLFAAADLATEAEPARDFRPVVIEQDISSSSRSGPHYYLTLSAWSDQPRGERFTVSQAVYYQTPVGGVVCLERHTGGLGVDWFELNGCPLPRAAPQA